MTVKKTRKKPKKVQGRFDWIEIKRDYISDPHVSLKDIAKKHGVTNWAINKRAREEKWTSLRNELVAEAEKGMVKKAQYDLVEIKERHIKIGRLLQKIGLEAIEKKKYVPRGAKEARSFISAGIKIEKEALTEGQDRTSGPAIVNIVAQEKDILKPYVEKIDIQEGEEVKDGEVEVGNKSTEGIGI